MTTINPLMPTTSLPLPNQVPSPKEIRSIRHREAYHLTQLGTPAPPVSPSLSKLLDERDPESGFGVKPPGPQGFLFYCKDLEVLDALPARPSDVKVFNRHSKAFKDGYVPGQNPYKPEGTSDPNRPASPPTGKPFPFRGSVDSKANNRKSTPEFDRKAGSAGTGSQDGSNKSTKGPSSKKSSKKKSDNERLARKEEKRRRAHGPPIIIKAVEDFPEEAQKLIRKTKIPEAQLLANLSVIVHIIRFRTGFNVRTEDEMTKGREERNGKEGGEGEGSLNEVRSDGDNVSGAHSRNTDAGANSANPGGEGTQNSRQQKEKDDYDSDALDPSIIPRGGEDLLSDSTDLKKMYKNLQQAGRGGFGSVFVAKSTIDKCDIAIKKLPHTTKKMKRTNFNEIGFLNSCKHSNIVKYYRSHLIDDEIWLVMEYMQGGTLAEAVERYSFAESSVAYVAREILRALDYLHNHSLVHRDLKSANVMLTVEGKIKLIDFGLCVDFTQRKLCHMAGSPFWMPPEMILGIPHGTPADMWSFAICLLELANGEPPNRKSPVRAMFLAATEGIHLAPEKYSPEFQDFFGKVSTNRPNKASHRKRAPEAPIFV